MQMNAILRSHAETIISHAFKVFLNSSFLGRKLPLKYSNYTMDHHSGNYILNVPFEPASNTFKQWKLSCRASLALDFLKSPWCGK